MLGHVLATLSPKFIVVRSSDSRRSQLRGSSGALKHCDELGYLSNDIAAHSGSLQCTLQIDEHRTLSTLQLVRCA